MAEHRGRGTHGLAHGLSRIGELARGGDHCHGLDQPLGRVGIGQRPEDLEGQLRQAVAVGGKRQFLEDDISRAAISGGLGGAHLGRNERIGRLRLVARIPAPGDPGHVERLAVGPDAPDAGDWPLAERHGEAGVVEVFGRLDPATAAALAATLRRGLGLLAESVAQTMLPPMRMRP